MSQFGSLGHPAQILLVEDNPLDVKLTKLAFEKIDIAHVIHVARDGHAAMEFLRREGAQTDAERPDVILLDLNLPGKDGREVLKEVKQDPDLQHIPVIVLTTSDAEADRSLTYSQHANAYLTKPMELDQWDELVTGFANFWLKLVRYPPRPDVGQLRRV